MGVGVGLEQQLIERQYQVRRSREEGADKWRSCSPQKQQR